MDLAAQEIPAAFHLCSDCSLNSLRLRQPSNKIRTRRPETTALPPHDLVQHCMHDTHTDPRILDMLPPDLVITALARLASSCSLQSPQSRSCHSCSAMTSDVIFDLLDPRFSDLIPQVLHYLHGGFTSVAATCSALLQGVLACGQAKLRLDARVANLEW